MPHDWTIDRFLTFALGLSTFESLDSATIQELGESLAFLVQQQAAFSQVLAQQSDTITRQAYTIEMQAACIERLSGALQTLRAGAWQWGEEEDAP
jgi:hypothetical protein